MLLLTILLTQIMSALPCRIIVVSSVKAICWLSLKAPKDSLKVVKKIFVILLSLHYSGSLFDDDRCREAKVQG